MAPTADMLKIRAAVKEIWHTMVTQLGGWNRDKVCCIDAAQFRDMDKVIKAGVLAEFATFLREPVAAALTMEFNGLVLLGPKRIIEGPKYSESFKLNISDLDGTAEGSAQDINPENDTTMSSDGDIANSPSSDNTTLGGENMSVEDALIARLISDNSSNAALEGTGNQQGSTGRGPRRPPNAFILYRKDKQALVKEAYPDIVNNEISIFVAALWKNESELVQKCYKRAADILRDNFLALHPGYRYNPRRPHQIPRRNRKGDVIPRSPVKISRKGNQALGGRNTCRIPSRMPTIPIDPSNPFGNIPRQVLFATPMDLVGGKVPVSQTASVKWSTSSHAYPLAADVRDIILARFPGTTHVVRGPVETTLVAQLPHMPTPMITAVIRNDNMDAIYAAATAQQHNGEASLVQDHPASDQILFPMEAVPFAPENNEAEHPPQFHDGYGPDVVGDFDFFNENI